MKKILLLALICLIATETTDDERAYEDILGPAYNAKNKGNEACTSRYVYDASAGDWFDNIEKDDSKIPGGVSDCVDLVLWNPSKKMYYDHCCYVRFQINGTMHAGCIGLSEEQYLDTTTTMRRMENGDHNIWTRKAANSKVYQLSCYSSYLKSIASILILALFF